jgi:hypothetical protein
MGTGIGSAVRFFPRLRLWFRAGSPITGRVSLMGDLLGDPRQQKLPSGSF